MRIRTIQRESGTYIRVPDDLRRAEEVELFLLRDGYYLLSMPLGGEAENSGRQTSAGYSKQETGNRKPEDAGGITQLEKKVLGKLASIKFNRRTASSISREFSRQEREALLSLEKKGVVTFIKSGKYPGGVYNIQNGFYPQHRKEAAEDCSGADLEKQLFRDGYAVVPDPRAAQALSDMLQRQKNAVTGVKSFDGKYYVATRAHMERVRRVLARWREEHADPKAVGAKFGIHPDSVKAVLKILAEGGEYVEKGEVFLKVE
ncbi:MAG: hypothetical protein AB1657_03630 [Candidatus Micrarchaeota archaeon]